MDSTSRAGAARRPALVGAITVLLLGLVGTPAGADHDRQSTTCAPFPWESEAQLSVLPFVSPNGAHCWRPVIWPGAGHLLTRPQVDDFRSHFAGRGYDQNFVWYAPQEQVRVADYAGRSWTGCGHLPTGLLEICAPGSINTSNLGEYFNLAADPRLTVLRWKQDWISLVCGNSLARLGTDTPVPTIPIDKFIDENRNGAVDGGDVTSGPAVSGIAFEIWRTAKPSWVDDPLGHVATLFTDANGDIEFRLDGHGPGTYEVREVVPVASFATTEAVRTVDVDAGIGDHRFPVQRFGNAPATVDVEKVGFEVAQIPDRIEVRTDTEIAVDLTIRNNGPADHVPVRDTVRAFASDDCVITPRDEETIEVTLGRGESHRRRVTFTVNCDLPSTHDFRFEDELEVLDGRLTDTNPSNNLRTAAQQHPVWAETDLSTQTQLVCPTSTEVGVPITCDLRVDVTNVGYGPLDGTVGVDLAQTRGPDDCTLSPASLSLPARALADGETRRLHEAVSVECGYRSFHAIDATSKVTADDEHVEDTSPGNDGSSARAEFAVFHDADLRPTDSRLFCDEGIGSAAPFTCRVAVEVVNNGPAPDVVSVVEATIGQYAESTSCTVGPAATLVVGRTLAVGVRQTVELVWEVRCVPSTVLHPFHFVADVRPSEQEPHAVDVSSPIEDVWTVPYCLPTENPHGQREPQAPGSGQNEDGFYVFGTLPSAGREPVLIRDDGSGALFGPFDSGVRIKWVEANGAQPAVTPMGGNNGKGKGQATAVSFMIRAQGDAVASYFDEDGNEITVACRVPPFPK